MKEKISIIGAGSWGTTLGVILAKKGLRVELHSVFEKDNIKMRKQRENADFLKGVKFPSNLDINLSLKNTLKNKIIVIAIPVKFIRGVLIRIKEQAVSLKNKIFVSVAKGIEEKSLKMPSKIIEEELGRVKTGVLSGPTIAKEVIKGIPTTCIIASKNRKVAIRLQDVFNTKRFRVYTHNDIMGVELGSALKNIVAIACGISDGLGFGTNTKATLVTRGLVEIIRLGKKAGAKPSTFMGISGLGDLVTTCFSSYSRNRFVGERIGRGEKLRDILKNMNMVAEGVTTVNSAYQLSRKLNIDMPITREVFLILYKNKSAAKAVRDLMTRPLKAESIV